MNPKHLQFFRRNPLRGDYSFLAATQEEGIFFDKRGNPYSSYPIPSHGAKYQGTKTYFIQESLSKFLTNFISNEARNSFLSVLGLSNPQVVVTKEMTEEFILKLKQNRAFNEDSAMEVENYNVGLALVEKGLIKEYDDRFFAEENGLIQTAFNV